MKIGTLILRWNQFLSFSPLLAASKNADWVFWPGCAAMKLDHHFIHNTYEILRLEKPEMGFSSWCCGKPTISAGSNRDKKKRMQQLEAYFKESGIQGVYTLCPNCQRTLNQSGFVEALPVWPVLDSYYRSEMAFQQKFTGRYLLHDPCAARMDTQSHKAVRNLLTNCNIHWNEFSKHESHTCCCGRKNMVFLTDPNKSKEMLRSRLKEASDTPIITYCESCAEAFRGGGSKAYHLLEILYGTPSRRRLKSRIKTAHMEVRYD